MVYELSFTKVLVYFSICTLFILPILTSCDTVENDIATDPRKFSWSLDTLLNPRTDQSARFDIWGASGTDIYTVGFVDAGEVKCGILMETPGNLFLYRLPKEVH